MPFRDFDDLHSFNVYFDVFETDTSPGSRSIDLARVEWLTDDVEEGEDRESLRVRGNSPPLALRNELKTGVDGGTMGPTPTITARQFVDDPQLDVLTPPHEGSAVGVVYGVRTVQLCNYWGITALGSILGDSHWVSTVDSSIIGPQLGLVWSETRGPLSFEMQGTAIAGYNFGRTKLNSELAAVSSRAPPIDRSTVVRPRPTTPFHTVRSVPSASSGWMGSSVLRRRSR